MIDYSKYPRIQEIIDSAPVPITKLEYASAEPTLLTSGALGVQQNQRVLLDKNSSHPKGIALGLASCVGVIIKVEVEPGIFDINVWHGNSCDPGLIQRMVDETRKGDETKKATICVAGGEDGYIVFYEGLLRQAVNVPNVEIELDLFPKRNPQNVFGFSVGCDVNGKITRDEITLETFDRAKHDLRTPSPEVAQHKSVETPFAVPDLSIQH